MRPLLFNSLTYGSFYVAAEFLRQTYNPASASTRALTYSQSASVRTSFVDLRNVSISESNLMKRLHEINDYCGLDHDTKGPCLEGGASSYNWAQLKRYAVFGCFLAGPTLHFWYKWLDSLYSGLTPRTILKKLLADQFVLTPPLLVLFFISMSVMESKSDLLEECKDKLGKTFATSCMYWIPVQCVNFIFVPPSLRVLYVSVAAFLWLNILCYLKSLPSSSNPSTT